MVSASAKFNTIQPFILKFVYVLVQTFKIHCEMVVNYLKEFDSSYDFLSEYAKRWNAYTAAIKELDERFRCISNIINYIYAQKWKDFTQVPLFSIMRCMVIVWRRKV